MHMSHGSPWWRRPMENRRSATMATVGNPDPLGRLGWWGRWLVPTDSLTISSGIYWIDSKLHGRMWGHYIHSGTPGELSTPSLDTSPPGRTQSPGWIWPPCWGSAGTEWGTSWTCFSPSQSASIWQTGGSSPLWGISLPRASHQWWIFRGDPLSCVVPSILYPGMTTSLMPRESPRPNGSWFCASGREIFRRTSLRCNVGGWPFFP